MVVVTLGVGIGAATAMFGVVNGVLLSPLPIREQERVVVLRKEQLVGNEALVPFSVRDFRDFASQTRTLDAVAGAQYDGAWPATMRDGDRVLSPNTAVVSGNYFSTLGVRAAVGRCSWRPTTSWAVTRSPSAIRCGSARSAAIGSRRPRATRGG